MLSQSDRERNTHTHTHTEREREREREETAQSRMIRFPALLNKKSGNYKRALLY